MSNHRMFPQPAGFIWLVSALALNAVSAGCVGPPVDDAPPAMLRAAIVIDRTVHTFVEAFKVSVVKATTRQGAPVACADFPATMRTESPELVSVAEQQIPWDRAPSEAQLQLSVPANESLVIVAKGLAQTPQGAFVIARSCADNVKYVGGTSPQQQIDVRATTGAACAVAGDCEPGLDCYQSAEMPGGYCARQSCTTESDCLPGSSCVADAASGGLCARICNNLSDCQGGHQCLKRRSPDGSCGSMVCVFPLWNKNQECS